VGVEGVLDLLVGELDDAMRIGVVKSHLAKELPPRLPDPVCEVIVSRNHGLRIALDAVLLYDVPEFRGKDLWQEFFLITLRPGIGPFLDFPESISC